MLGRDRSRPLSVWRGTSEERQRLNTAVRQHCTCTTGIFGKVSTVCSVHAMLLDQRVLDHLLYVYRMKDRFARAERWVEHPLTSGKSREEPL